MYIQSCVREKGQSLVEFAAIAPILVLLILGIMEFGRAFYAYATIVNAASEGARYSIVDPNNTDCIKKVVENYSVILGLTHSNITVNNSVVGVNKPVGVMVQYSFASAVPLIPDLSFSSGSTMTIAYVPASVGTCPFP